MFTLHWELYMEASLASLGVRSLMDIKSAEYEFIVVLWAHVFFLQRRDARLLGTWVYLQVFVKSCCLTLRAICT